LQEVVLANFTTTCGIGTKLYIHFVFALSHKYTSTQDKDMASTSRNLRARLSRHDIDIILDSHSDEYDIDLDETDEEDDDLTGQPLNPPVGVTKQGGRTNRGAHDRATNDFRRR
jgi:ribose 5-phosphate isomerase